MAAFAKSWRRREVAKCLNHQGAAPKLTAEEQVIPLCTTPWESKWRERRGSNPRPSA